MLYAAALLLSLVSVDDPGVVNLSIPPQWAIAGQEWLLYWDDCIQVDGAWSYDITWSLTPSPSSGPTYSSSGLAWTPANAGDYVLDVEFTSSGVHVANVSADLHVSAASSLTGSISVFGDSLSGGNVWQKTIATAEPGLSWLGVVATTNGLLRDSRGGWTYNAFIKSSGSDMSPLVCGPGAYCADAGVPTLIVWACGTNDASQVYSVPTYVYPIVANLDRLLVEWRQAYPSVRHVIWTPPPGADTDAPFIANYAGTPMEDQYYWEQRQRTLSRLIISQYANRESEGIYVAATATGVDTTNDYPITNALHPTTTGYNHVAAAMRAVFSGAGL